jgi:glycosyltransferase involved in cell wall biosynthesis
VTIVCLASRSTVDDLPSNVTVLVRRPPGPAIIPGAPNPFFSGTSGRVARLMGRGAWLVTYIRGLRSWGRVAVQAAGPVGAWHAHDLTGLAAVVPNLRRGVPVVFDSHELFLETGTALRLPGPARAILRAYERRLVARVAAVITVNEAVAGVLEREHRRGRVRAIHNCPNRWIPPREPPRRIRETAGIPAEAPVVLYHGALSADRGIEQLIDALRAPGLERAHLVLMGYGELRDELAARAAAEPSARVHVLEPVPPAELLEWVASADVGAMPVQATTMNLRLSTPNKLFECLAAGTPVVASDFPAIRRIVVDDPGGVLGAVCDPADVRAIAGAIGSILRLAPAELAGLRRRCRLAADERWNWENEARTLLAVYEEVLPRGT